MSIDVISLIRPNVRELTPYRAARHDHTAGILLDANESPYGERAVSLDVRFNRYPDPLQTQLRSSLGALDRLPPDNVMAGNGADEVIDLLIRIFCAPGRDAIAIAEPTYGMYRVAAAINDVAVIGVPLDDRFQLDPDTALARLGPDVKLFFCCSPNNPTGTVVPRETIVRLCERFDGIVVVDEAYVDFSDVPSLADLVPLTPNLLLLRTLSKGHALAALRIGWAIADPSIIEYLLKIKPPYNIGGLSAAAALAVLARPEEKAGRIALVRRERERLAGRLAGMDAIEQVWPSQGNFLLARAADAKKLCDHLAGHGIIVRNRDGEPGLKNCLRITVGTPEENDLLIDAIGRPTR